MMKLTSITAVALCALAANAKDFNVRDYGAKGDGTVKDTGPKDGVRFEKCRFSEESDALFKEKGFAHVRGGHTGIAPYDPKGEKQEGLRPIHTVDRAFFPASELNGRFRLDTVMVGEAYHTDMEDILACIRRCAERKEAFVLASHGISPNAKDINMKTEWLERILATASECGVAVVGFDELQ